MPVETQGEVTILISEADEAIRAWLRKELQGYQIIETSSGEQALDRATNTAVDILLTGQQLPDMSGLELGQRFTKKSAGRGQPVGPSIVMLSPNPDMATLQAAYGAGFSGVLPAHPSGLELQNAIQMALKVRTIEEQISQLFREFQRLADTDPLTQLPNRRYLEGASSRELSRAQRTGEPLAVLMLDIDWFKEVNDQYGHEVGDEVLVHFSKLLRQHLRLHDILVRYGGDEFVAVLPATNRQQARQVAEKLRKVVHDMVFEVPDDGSIQFTMSVGIAMWDETQATLDSTIRLADQALYRSKQKGRNRTSFSNTPSHET
jgi:two-component system, cell cycle response regulator